MDCTVFGAVDALYLTLWNRWPDADLAVEGDGSLLDLWREGVNITWS